MIFSFTTIIQWLLTYKYFILFPVVVVEGPIATIIAGFLASIGHLNLYIAYGLIIVADVVGDSIYYALGRWGTRFVERWGHYIGLTIERVKKIELHYTHHAGKTLILGKLAHSIEIPFLVFAGIAKVSYRKFLLYVFIPSIPKSLLFILIGYYFGRAFDEINRYLSYTAFIMLAAAIVLVIIYFIIRKVSQKYTK